MSKLTNRTYRHEQLRYVAGFFTVLGLIMVAYMSVVYEWLDGVALVAALLVIAAAQFIIQLVVFLHVGDEQKPRWTLWSIIYTMVMMLIIVVASLWIMANMNYNMMMTPEQMQEFMLQQNKKGF